MWYPPDNVWPQACYTPVTATPLDNPKLLARTHALSTRLGLERQPETWWTKWLNGTPQIGMSESYATVYSGHQFGVYVPQLGDGRALGWGFRKDDNGCYWEYQTKGSGLTPFSRMGDGRAVLRSSIREYLCSEHMNGLGIPSTRALALLGSGTPVRRETWEMAAIVLRVAPSFVRFGTLQYLAQTEQTDALDQLLATLCQSQDSGFSVRDWFLALCHDTALLCAQWQAVGFCHGVLNTDNMSVHSLTLDYGPFGFIETYDPGHICNHSDDTGRYAYWAQPEVVGWNLLQLGRALSRYFPESLLREGLQQYQAHFDNAYLTQMAKKLGLPNSLVTWDYIQKLVTMLSQSGLDYTRFMRHLSTDPDDGTWLRHESVTSAPADAWLNSYRQERLPSLQPRMRQHNPAYVLRNWVAQWVIDEAKSGNTTVIEAVLEVMRRPYDEHPEWSHLRESAPANYRGLAVSCSS